MTATSNIPLKVPFKEKDEAKSLGARWNPEAKHWYVPEGVDTTLFEKWLDGAPAPIAAPGAVPATKPEKTDSTLSANADMDDINSMLRDAYEIGDD
ncbi:MAG: DUF5710 domain-containing protein [Methylophilaceae bacterium]